MIQIYKLTLDTSCFDEESLELLDELILLKENNIIDVSHEMYTEIENDDWISDKKDEVLRRFYRFSKPNVDACCMPIELANDNSKAEEYHNKKRGFSSEELHQIHLKVDSILHPEGFCGKKIKNKYFDGKILSLHIARKGGIFLTKDKRFINKKEELEKAFPNTRIDRFDRNFVSTLKEL